MLCSRNWRFIWSSTTHLGWFTQSSLTMTTLLRRLRLLRMSCRTSLSLLFAFTSSCSFSIEHTINAYDSSLIIFIHRCFTSPCNQLRSTWGTRYWHSFALPWDVENSWGLIYLLLVDRYFTNTFYLQGRYLLFAFNYNFHIIFTFWILLIYLWSFNN